MIVDASVAVAWYVAHPWSVPARRAAEQFPLLRAPDLIVAEVANALRKHIRTGALDEGRAAAALDNLTTAVVLVPLTGLHGDALRLSLAFDHPVYDCFYLALAAHEDTRLITADRKLAALGKRAKVTTEFLGAHQ